MFSLHAVITSFASEEREEGEGVVRTTWRDEGGDVILVSSVRDVGGVHAVRYAGGAPVYVAFTKGDVIVSRAFTTRGLDLRIAVQELDVDADGFPDGIYVEAVDGERDSLAFVVDREDGIVRIRPFSHFGVELEEGEFLYDVLTTFLKRRRGVEDQDGR